MEPPARFAPPARARTRERCKPEPQKIPSAKGFQTPSRDGYAALLLQAMRDVAETPNRVTAAHDPAIDPVCWFCHIMHSRSRVRSRSGRAADPRHVLVYEVAPDGIVDTLAIVPDLVPREIAVARIRRLRPARG